MSTPIVIANASFEQTAHANGSWSPGIPGWTVSTAVGGDAGDFNPTAGQVNNATITGVDVAYLFKTGTAGSFASISQTTATTYTAGNTYQFTLDIGDGNYSPSGDVPFVVNIYAGTTVIGTLSTTTGDIGALQSYTVSSTVKDPALNGQAIRIEISLPPGGPAGEILVDNVQGVVFPPPDGVVEGTTGADLIDVAYTGDPEGERVDNADGPGGSDDDTIEAGGGNDTVFGGLGDDLIDGGLGDDLLYGDFGDGGFTTESLNWEAQGLDGTSLAAGFTQNTGLMDVTVSFADDGNNNPGFFVSTTATYTDAGEPFDPTSNLRLSGTGDAQTSTTTISFASADPTAQDEVTNVIFRFSDIDAGNFRDEITVSAFDAAGNPVAVTITPSGNDTVSGNTIIAGAGGDAPGDANGSALIEIAGPVATIEISYANGLANFQNFWVSDLFFDVLPTGGGNDTIAGGAGADTIFGDAGDDVLAGGTAADSVLGGAGNDTIDAGQGDTLSGGDGDDVFRLVDLAEVGSGSITILGGEGGETGGDTLDLGGLADRTTLSFTVNTADEKQGTVTMNDGSVVSFTNIENIICFTPGTLIDTAQGPRPVEDLRPGDWVVTRDNGLQQLRWKGQRRVCATGAQAPVRIDPVLLPDARAPLLVSPQHRILWHGYRAQMLFGETEVLVSAKHLLSNPGAQRIEGGEVTYLHLMFDRHEVIFANGVPTESFYPGEMALYATSDVAREELFRLFPDLRTGLGGFGDTARLCLKAHEATLLVA